MKSTIFRTPRIIMNSEYVNKTNETDSSKAPPTLNQKVFKK